ncbi:MAG: hypothetical protein ABIH04_10845 [Planctomycetota bacterium]
MRLITLIATLFLAVLSVAGCATEERTVYISSPARRTLSKLPKMWNYDDPRFGIEAEFIQNEQMRCLTLALWHQGARVDYPSLMVISGAAANFHYNPNEKFWCYMLSPDSPEWRALKSTGYDFSFLAPVSPEQAYAFIKNRISAGKLVIGSWLSPVVFYGFDESSEEPVLYYYNNPFAMEGGKWTMTEFAKEYWGAKVSKELFAVTEKRADVDVTKAVEYAMKRIVLCAKQNRLEKSLYLENYDVSGIETGFKAYEAYAQDLEDMSKKMKKTTDDKDGYFDIGWGCYAIYPQWTARAAVAVFLRRYAPEHYKEYYHEHLDKAAEYYDREIEAWKKWEKHLGRNIELWKKDEKAATADFQKRWNDPKHRKAGAAAVREALKYEKLAVAELEEVLRAPIREE